MDLINQEIDTLTKQANYIATEYLPSPMYQQDPEMAEYLEEKLANIYQQITNLRRLKSTLKTAHMVAYQKAFAQFP